jgi:succinyl-diaminopimelate desuccinylase
MMVELLDKIDEYRDYAVSLLSQMIETVAISPDNGGQGEFDKAELLMQHLDGFKVERYDVEDERAKENIRPNIVARIKGENDRTLWIVSHLDVVPEGDRTLWHTEPFKATVSGGKIYGRGSEDNGQAIVSSLIAAKAILDLGLKPKYSLALAFVSDEETGSRYGIQHLLKEGVFNKDDLVVVPDAGSPDGSMIEIAEKSILWLKFMVYGKQGHASRPDTSYNAFRRAIKFLRDLDKALHTKFDEENDLFTPPVSTFEPTKRERNVDNINTIPGLDVSYMDCRIIPDYDVEDILKFIMEFKREYELSDGYRIDVDIVQKESSPPTPERSEVVQLLKKALKISRNIHARVYGIGGNTCGAFFRKAGIETAVWSTVDGMAHMPNEYAVLGNIIEDAKTLALMPFL